MSKPNLQKMPIEELVRYVTLHWQETCLQAIEAMEEYITWELAKGKSDEATPVIRALNNYVTVDQPAAERLLGGELQHWRQRFGSDATVRANILSCLRESEAVQQKIQKAVDAIKA